MAINKAYLTSNKTPSGDECYTPRYAVYPLLPYLKKDWTIWCPFDEPQSAFVTILQAHGFKVIATHLINGEKEDFFKFTPKHFDCIVSNPPFSKKDEVLERCYQLGKPFALLMPIQSLQSLFRFNLYHQYGLHLICFDQRVNYWVNGKIKKGCHFGSAYFCHQLFDTKDQNALHFVPLDQKLVELEYQSEPIVSTYVVPTSKPDDKKP